MKTPMGWARAQLIYDKLPHLPKFNTLLEAMCLLVRSHHSRASTLGVRAQAQAALGGEAAEKAWKDFTNHMNRVQIEDTTARMRARLDDLGKIKEIRMRPLLPTRPVKELPRVNNPRAKKIFSELRPLSKRPRRARDLR
tara:strand:- start:157 stop:573 length:417 start_codon:yes stop_codon:yes gene_type:complete